MPSRRRRAQAAYSSLIWPQTTDTVDLEIAAWSPSASARAASMSRTDSPRTNEAITSVSSALVLVTWLPNSRDANASVVPRSFGRDSCTGPAVDLTVTSRYPLRDPSRASSQPAARWYRSRPRNSVTSASSAACISSCAPSRATSSRISGSALS